jgi:hypothetical protein
MRRLPPPWCLQWSGNGELAPLDRQDLWVCLCLPGVSVPQSALRPAEGLPSVPRPLGLPQPCR